MHEYIAAHIEPIKRTLCCGMQYATQDSTVCVQLHTRIVLSWHNQAVHFHNLCCRSLEVQQTWLTWSAGASNLPRDEGNAVLPSQAGDSQLIRLPGQTRVSPEEYKEFLGLGHGDVFDLDPDRSYTCMT